MVTVAILVIAHPQDYQVLAVQELAAMLAQK
jgi:hypothetical protein